MLAGRVGPKDRQRRRFRGPAPDRANSGSVTCLQPRRNPTSDDRGTTHCASTDRTAVSRPEAGQSTTISDGRPPQRSLSATSHAPTHTAPPSRRSIPHLAQRLKPNRDEFQARPECGAGSVISDPVRARFPKRSPVARKIAKRLTISQKGVVRAGANGRMTDHGMRCLSQVPQRVTAERSGGPAANAPSGLIRRKKGKFAFMNPLPTNAGVQRSLPAKIGA
jgi:hypothetical protein